MPDGSDDPSDVPDDDPSDVPDDDPSDIPDDDPSDVSHDGPDDDPSGDGATGPLTDSGGDASTDVDAPDVFRFQFDPSEDDPVFDVVNAIAELEGQDVTDVPPLHEVVDHVIDDVFSTPPVPSAGLRVEFTYAGYRIDLHQDGRATFVKVM